MPGYVPILKGKEGEYGALEELLSSAKDVIRPLIEVPPIPFDYVAEAPTKTLEDHVRGIPDRLARCWPGRDLYLDISFPEAERLISGETVLARLIRECAEREVTALPVITPDTPRVFLDSVRAHQRSGGNFAIRLNVAAFDDAADQGPDDLVARLLEATGASDARAADLILDLADLGPDLSRAVLVIRSVLLQAPRMHEWHTVIVAGASFPENLSEVSPDATSRLPRIEWQAWQRLHRRPAERRELVFGDYGIANPVVAELDPRTMRMSASIRYTTESDWLVVKGRNVRQHGFDQYYQLAQQLVEMPEFSGEDFSAGDRFIARCARHEIGPGNATTWRKVGTNHHLTFVAAAVSAIGPHGA